ncbi:MAG: lipid-A-disaccharide synthase [Verrucomicrobia bacterium]|nr:lipid-A-disaccharide synthase [Verrucomicrobiota bacterium]
MPTLFVLSGEPSGDNHAAAAVAEMLRREPKLRVIGLGGPRLRAVAGDGLEDWSSEAAVVGLVEVLKKYGWFRQKFAQTLVRIRAEQPDAVLLVDYPGFNLRLAKALRKAGYAGRILYYISPQVWAWNRGRIPKMAKLLDAMFCIFPFEQPLFAAAGLPTEFVGHPMIDTLARERSQEPRDPQLVALLPGSRAREVRLIFPAMLGAAALLARERPDLRFAAAAANADREREMLALREASGLSAEQCRIERGTAHALMQQCGVGLVASGTATVEAAFFGLPHGIAYRVAPLTYAVGRMLIKVAHLGMINVLAGREVVREFLQSRCTPELLAGELLRLHDDPAAREQQLREVAAVVATLGEGGAAERAAEAILRALRAPR